MPVGFLTMFCLINELVINTWQVNVSKTNWYALNWNRGSSVTGDRQAYFRHGYHYHSLSTGLPFLFDSLRLVIFTRLRKRLIKHEFHKLYNAEKARATEAVLMYDKNQFGEP